VSEEKDKMRLLFEGAIKLQQELIADSQRRIDHYNWAISEMARQADEAMTVIEPADPKMLEICKAIVQDVA